MLASRKLQNPLDSSDPNFRCSNRLDLKQLKQSSNAMQTLVEESSVISNEEEELEEKIEEEEHDDDDDICSSYTSTSSIPDDNIDFDLVYARHTFIASIDGQASVVKGDTMTLIDDSNSYWWLIRALKTSEVGYIPAELVEMPQERLARLNKHRNVEVTSLNRIQYYNHQKSLSTRADVTSAVPSSKHTVKGTRKHVQLSRTLCCQKQVLYDNSDDDEMEIENEDSSLYTISYEEYTEEMPLSAYLASEHDESFARSTAESKKKDKYAPLINPYFNKPRTASTSTLASPAYVSAHSTLAPINIAINTPSLKVNESPSIEVCQQDGTVDNDSNLQTIDDDTPAFLYSTLSDSASNPNMTKKTATSPSISTIISNINLPSPPLSPPDEVLDSRYSNQPSFVSNALPDSGQALTLSSESKNIPEHIENSSTMSTAPTTKGAANTVSGLKRLLSFGKKTKTAESDNSKLAATNASDIKADEQSVNDWNSGKHYHVLRIFAGDSIQTGTSYNTVTITPEMNADELLKFTLQKFHISLISDNVTSSGIEYYLTVKSMDSDEITLMPQDKPLSILKSLSDHLTEPMPSLKIINRLSKEQPSIQITRVGVSKARKRAQARFGDDSLIRFSLHKRIKRIIDETDCNDVGQMYIKLCFYTDETLPTHDEDSNSRSNSMKKPLTSKGTLGLLRKSSLLRADHHVTTLQQQQHNQTKLLEQKSGRERFEKLVPVSITTTMSELVNTALEKFHITTINSTYYYMALSVNDQETPLEMQSTIADILNDPCFSSRKGCSEKVFVLRSQSIQSTIASFSISSNTSLLTDSETLCSLTDQENKVKTIKDSEVAENYNISGGGGGGFMKRFLPNTRSESLAENPTYAHQRPVLVNLPTRSNSLTVMSTATGKSKSKVSPVSNELQAGYLEQRKLPVRSSSLRIHTIKSLDEAGSSSISRLSTLQRELEQIKT